MLWEEEEIHERTSVQFVPFSHVSCDCIFILFTPPEGRHDLTRLEEKNGYLSEIEVDEMLGFVCYIAAEVAAHDAMPCWVVLFVELFLDVCCNVLFDVVLLKGLRGTIDRVLLHVFCHIGILDHCLPVSHNAAKIQTNKIS